MTHRAPERSWAPSGAPPPSGSAAPPRVAPAAAAGWLAAVALALVAALSFRHGQDLGVFWRAGGRFLAGAPLYPPADGFLAYRYAPGVALLFAPLAAVPLAVAKAVWYGVLVAAGALAVWWLSRAGRDARPLAVAALAMLAVSRPLVEELACAQVNLVVLVGLLAAFHLDDRGRPLAAGLVVALATGLKLAPAVFALELALRGRWRGVLGIALGLVGLAVAPLPAYGVAGTARLHREWIASLAAASPDTAAAPGNQSLFGLAARLGWPAALGALAGVAVIAIALRARDLAARRSLLLLATALGSPMGWIQNYVTALPAAFAAVRSGPRRAAAAATAGALLLVPMYDLAGPRIEAWVFARSLPLAGMALLFLLAAPATGGRRRAPGGAVE